MTALLIAAVNLGGLVLILKACKGCPPAKHHPNPMARWVYHQPTNTWEHINPYLSDY